MKMRNCFFISAFVFTSFVFAQSTIEGTVSDGSGNPLVGANVIVEGTSLGAATDPNGVYMINVPEGNFRVVVIASYIGYKSSSSSVDVPVGGSVNLSFSLAIDPIGLKGVSVTALGFTANRDEQGSSSVSVAAADMNRSGESLMANSLAAKASNVIVNAQAGDPGASTSIRIRGANTISGASQPLIVIDGMPINNSTVYGGGNNISGGRSAGTVQQSRINDLNANDIESVEVLKGASAAALWGSRAANGVVMIKTKDGDAGRVKMNYKRTMSYDEIHERIPMQDEFGQGRNGSWTTHAESWGDRISDRAGGADEVEASGQHFVSEDGTFTQYEIITKNSKDTYVDENWNLAFQTGQYTQDDFQVTGGDASRTFLFSYSRLRQDGIIRNSFYDRDNFRLNTKFRLSDKISMESKASYTYTNSNRTQQSSNVTGLMLGLLRTAPDFDITHYKGTYVNSSGVEYGGRQRAYRRYMGGSSSNPIYNNPLWTIYEQKAGTKVDRFMMTNEMTVMPDDKTSFVIRAGIDAWGDDRSWFFPIGSSGSRNAGVFAEDALTNREVNYDFIARRNVDLGGMSLNITAGYNWWDRAYNRTSFNISSFLVNTDKETVNVNTAAEASTVDNSKLFIRSGRTYALLSLAAMDNLFLNFSGVSEEHSTISDPYFYPAMDLAYQFTDMLAGTPLSFGKFRLAWGQVGVRPSAHRFETLAESGFSYSAYSDPLDVSLFGGGYRVDDDKGNPSLKPELKTETEFGLDMRFLDDRFSLSITSYQNTIDDMLINVSKSPSTGYDTQYMNAASMENKGLELDGSFLLMNQADKALDLYFNWAKNENTVTDLAGTDVIFLGTGSVNSVAIVDHSLGALYGTGSETDDGTVGGTLILNEIGFPQITSLPIVLGDPNPDWRGTIGLNARWQNFNMNVLFEHSQGGDYSPRTQWVLRRFGTTAETGNFIESTPTELINVDGDTIAAGSSVRGTIHDFGGGDVLLDEAWYRHGIGGGFGDNQAYNFAVKDATFSRIRELSLSYTFTSPAFRETTKLSSVTLRWTGRNLWAWYKELVGLDPATNQAGVANGFGLDYFTNPSTKSYLFTVSVNF
ncbi:putative outer membrane protein, probably involved in nutrient binding [hydrothermal vent metagenome]|uniref:Putative outer membrane protein, probably involved in nutrient binding n=1 Tax=hydrothermal vent metagenome TaxID=652676 RepID=A0A160VHW8_9ZZZZ